MEHAVADGNACAGVTCEVGRQPLLDLVGLQGGKDAEQYLHGRCLQSGALRGGPGKSPRTPSHVGQLRRARMGGELACVPSARSEQQCAARAQRRAAWRWR